MDRKRRIEVSASTLVDLKAELFKKQAEFRRSKLQNETLDRPLSKLNLKKKQKQVQDTLGKSNSGLAERISKDLEESRLPEDDEIGKALEASRKKLEEKAVLYDKLMSGAQFPEEEDLYMVDFQRKVIAESEGKRPDRPPIDDDDDDDDDDDEVVRNADNSKQQTEQESEDWVDYTDSLGRSRRCLKADLPSMISMDEDLKRDRSTNQIKPVELDGEDDDEFIGPMPSRSDAVEESSEPTGPMHYQNVQNSEVRNHGVGYFAFSTSEEERQKQLELLNSLRNQTQEQRDRRERIKAKRKDALKARLDKVKRRKKIQNGETLSDEDADKSDGDFDNFVPRVEETLSTEPAILATADSAATKVEMPAKVRPWDKGKIGVPGILQPFRKSSQKEYVNKRRDERAAEFAPPTSYRVDRDPPRFDSKIHKHPVQPSPPSDREPLVFCPPDVSRPPPNYQFGRDPPPIFNNCDTELSEGQPPTQSSCHRNPIEEMHEFFKKTWQESLAKDATMSQDALIGPTHVEEKDSIGEIPLPPS